MWKVYGSGDDSIFAYGAFSLNDEFRNIKRTELNDYKEQRSLKSRYHDVYGSNCGSHSFRSQRVIQA